MTAPRKPDIALAILGGIAILASGSIVIGQNFKLEAHPRLIGHGCGPEGLTLAAVDEDDIAHRCRWIEPVDQACRIQGESLPVDECVTYWGRIK